MKKTLFLLSAFLCVQTTSKGATVFYGFGTTGQETTAETGAPYNPTTLNGLTATAVTDPANTIGIEISSAATTPAGAPFLRVDPQGNSSTAAQAVTNNKYFQFTVNTLTGTFLPSNTLAFDVARGGAGTPRGYAVRSSADNFATDIAAADVLTVRPAYTNVFLALTNPAIPTLNTLTFRIYSYSPGGGASVDFDNILFTSIPEPSRAMLMTSGLLGLFIRRRRAVHPTPVPTPLPAQAAA